MRQFPQELVDLVIDDAAAPDTTDIGTCGLVCRQWLPRSRRHLFSDIILSNSHPSAIQTFLDLVDASSIPIFPLVKSLDMHLVNGPFAEMHTARLYDCHAIADLRIHAPLQPLHDRMEPVQDLQFQCWLQTHIPRFGSACLSLTRFELVLASDMPFRIIAESICSLPSLTHLRICGHGDGYGVLESGTVPPTDTFPPHLHTLDIALDRGINLFFEWLLSYDESPVFTSLKLGGVASGAPLGPIEVYLKRVAPQIEALEPALILSSLIFKATWDFEDRVMAFLPRLVHLSLTRQYARYLAHKLTLPSSHRLATLNVEVRPLVGPYGRMPWASLDATFGTPQFATLRRLSFADEVSGKNIITEEVRALMPQASARGILV
ncbi:hypothetical protein FB451DRAFT_1402155 [Mycena latifolia]|nr:hypothetical protein FB451DRAFT_1402155 [Mycena latifolia]